MDIRCRNCAHGKVWHQDEGRCYFDHECDCEAWNYGINVDKFDRGFTRCDECEDGWQDCGTGTYDHACPDCAHGLVPPDGMVEAAAASIQRDLRPVSDDFGLFQLVARAALIAVARWEATDDEVPLEAEEREWCATHDEPIVRFGSSGHVIDEGECEIVARLLVDPQEGESE